MAGEKGLFGPVKKILPIPIIATILSLRGKVWTRLLYRLRNLPLRGKFWMERFLLWKPN
jgi:hypothetical protein